MNRNHWGAPPDGRSRALSNGCTTRSRAATEIVGTRAMLEAFGRSMRTFLECERCLVLVRQRKTGLATNAVWVGCGRNPRPPSDAVSRVAAFLTLQKESLIEIPREEGVATEILGRSRSRKACALAGRIAVGKDGDLMFVAGWRSPLAPAEVGLVRRAATAMWELVRGLAHHRPVRSILDRSLEEFAAPTFAVDHRLRVLGTNQAGKQLLLAKSPVSLDHGTLVGANSAVSGLLQQALRDTTAARLENVWASMVIPLSTDHRAFAFAWVGAAPCEDQRDRVLIIIPQIDPAAGAKRIAAAFSLSWAEERIVSEIFLGRSPPRIGCDLDLTEATVRTYIKRIMLKIGINRQTEFYLLYILTLSPFVERYQRFSSTPPDGRAPCRNLEEAVGRKVVWNDRSLSA